MKKYLILYSLLFLCFSNAFSQNWVQRGQDIDGEKAWDNSGASLCMSSDGNTIAIGAAGNDQNGPDAGHVRIYSWTGSKWAQKGVDIDGENAKDQSGYSVSMSSDGNSLAIGAQGKFRSVVRVFTWNESAWIQKGLNIDEQAFGDKFGFSVHMSADGNTVAVGGPGNSDSAKDIGHVRVFRWLGQAWRQKGLNINGEATGDHSGFMVRMSSDGNTLAVGAIFNDGNGQESGHVRVFTWTGIVWLQKGADIDGEAPKDRSGWTVSMSSDGNTIAIGAWGNDVKGTHTGHVRVLKWGGASWVQKGLDIDGEKSRDRSGWGMSMSSDGNSIAIGAVGNDENGKESGHVRVFTWSENTWTQSGNDINGERSGDQSGWCVSLSSDGNIVAIGAKLNDGSAKDAGHVRVFHN